MKTKKKEVDPPKGLLEYMSSPEQMEAAQENAKRIAFERWKKKASGGIEPVYPELMFVGANAIKKPIINLSKSRPTTFQKMGKYIVPALNWLPEAYAVGESSFRNGGVMKTKQYYDSNPESKEKKKAYDTKYHSTEERKKYRAFLNKMNRKAGKYGNGDDLDYDHDEKRFMKATKNRAKK